MVKHFPNPIILASEEKATTQIQNVTKSLALFFKLSCWSDNGLVNWLVLWAQSTLIVLIFNQLERSAPFAAQSQ